MDFRLQQNPLRWTLDYNKTHQMDFRLQQNPLK